MIDVTYNGGKIIDSLEATPPVTVTYNSSTIATLNAGDTKTLSCNGKVMASNVVIGSKTLQCNGKLMASDVVINVTQSGETWVFNDYIGVPAGYTFSVPFTSDGIDYIRMDCIGATTRPPAPDRICYIDSDGNITYAYIGHWAKPEYKTITLQTPASGFMLTWLQANAVKQ